ncbi:RPL34 [Symbiodinium natans]|uniref:RPL34 protein n=1 Tax=Symbiodinium natans TaxID=878477 RepID=A0A812U7Y2_9DINO|nr:RPL34 [Symbiodinium natans]
MRGSLEGLRMHQARLEVVCRQAQENETKLKKQLEDLLVEAEKAKPKREDIERLFYSDQGWGTWEQDFRRVWTANAKSASSLQGIQPARPLQVSLLLPSLQKSGACLCSESPLAVFVPDFASAEECAKLIELGFRTCRRHNEDAQEMQRTGEASGEGIRGVATASLEVSQLSGEDHELMSEMQQRVANLTGIPIHEPEINPFLKFDLPAPSGTDVHAQGDDLSIGLHLDVNGGFPHCACSVILYLNEVEKGGRTVFPCAAPCACEEDNEEVARCLGLGEVLAGAGHTHTSHSGVAETLGEEAAELVRRASGSLAGLRVAPQRGAALCFFTLRTEGDRFMPDPASWHGGAAVAGRVGKWTLQIFKEVPISHRCGGPAEEDGSLQAKYIESLRQRLLQAAESRGYSYVLRTWSLESSVCIACLSPALVQAAEASRQVPCQPDDWSWTGENFEKPDDWEQSKDHQRSVRTDGDETLIGPDGAVYDVFYPGTSCPDEKEETSTTCSDSGGSPGPMPRARSAESSITGIVDFIRSAAIARYPARAKLFDVVHRASQVALGNHFQRLALIGSTALRIDTPDSDLDVVVYTCSSYGEDGMEHPAPDPIEALRQVTEALALEDPALKLQLVDCARVPVLTVLSADGRLSLDLTIDQPLGEWHVLWFKSLWHWDPYAAAADPVEKLPLPLQGETDEWSSGLEATALRCIKWWLRRRNIPVPKEGGYPTVVWTLMVLHVLRCTLFVNEESKQERSGRALLSALAAFFDRFATPGASSGTLSFCMGPDGMSTAFEPLPAYEDAYQYASDEAYGGLSVLDPTTTCETSVAFGVMPSELAPQLPAATRLLQAYELQRAQRLSASALASGEDTPELGAEALEELFMETSTPCNTMPAAAPSQPVAVIVLRDGELAVGILQKVVPKHGWTAPFLHRRDGVSSFALQLCEVRWSDGLLTPWESTSTEHWYHACDFVCLAILQPVFTRGQCRGKHLRRERNRWKVDPEGLERWQKMQALLSQVGLHQMHH